MSGWYAVRTKPRKEFFARENLLRQGYVVYLPVIRQFVRHARKLVKASRPFFAGYLFVNADDREYDWYAIDSTYGVAFSVRFGNVRPVVPLNLIEGLKALEDESGHIVFEQCEVSPFPRDGHVTVRLGDADIEGVFKGLDGEERAKVLIELLGKSQEVVVPLDAVASI